MAAAKRDLDRLYWLLMLSGPLTFAEIGQRTGWTRHRVNYTLDTLKRTQCAELIERGQHWGKWNEGIPGRRNRCGKWQAIREPAAAPPMDYASVADAAWEAV